MPLSLVREFAPYLIDAKTSASLSDCLAHITRELGFDHFDHPRHLVGERETSMRGLRASIRSSQEPR